MSRKTVASLAFGAWVALVVAAILFTTQSGGPSIAAQSTDASAPMATLPRLVTPPGPSNASPPVGPARTPVPGVVLGAFIPDAPTNPSRIDAYAELAGAMPHIVEWYQFWAGESNAFYSNAADAITARGAVPLVSWAPWAGRKYDPDWTLNSLIAGSHDAYIHQWTHDAAAWGYPIYVVLMSEMNGNWYPWSPGVNGSTSRQFVAAWRHIVDIARAEQAMNIRWVWCPYVDSSITFTRFATLYPGDAYVDWVCLDGYNWGESQSWSHWQDLYTVFKGSVDQMGALTSKPLMIAETAASEYGGDKAAWITTGFARLQKDLPQVRAVIWFDENKETDWRINSSPRSLSAFRAVATSPLFAGTLP